MVPNGDRKGSYTLAIRDSLMAALDAKWPRLKDQHGEPYRSRSQYVEDLIRRDRRA